MTQQITPRTTSPIDPSTIPGWGSDADPANDPTYPMRDRSQEIREGLSWARPDQQPETVEILRSVEHNRTPAVFGSAVPPRGVSGAIRRTAFNYSESQFAHWIMLMAADRVDMVEGVIEDVLRGRPPNLIKEYGLAAEWEHNRRPMVAKAAATTLGAAAVLGLGYYFMREGRRRREQAELERYPRAVAADILTH